MALPYNVQSHNSLGQSPTVTHSKKGGHPSPVIVAQLSGAFHHGNTFNKGRNYSGAGTTRHQTATIMSGRAAVYNTPPRQTNQTRGALFPCMPYCRVASFSAAVHCVNSRSRKRSRLNSAVMSGRAILLGTSTTLRPSKMGSRQTTTAMSARAALQDALPRQFNQTREQFSRMP